MCRIQGKPFQTGHDPRRHTFTREECRRGFVAAEESIARRYPGSDPHFLMCALIGSKPLHCFLPDLREVAGMSDEQIAARYAQ